MVEPLLLTRLRNERTQDDTNAQEPEKNRFKPKQRKPLSYKKKKNHEHTQKLTKITFCFLSNQFYTAHMTLYPIWFKMPQN